jgi:hypothetical protein
MLRLVLVLVLVLVLAWVPGIAGTGIGPQG